MARITMKEIGKKLNISQSTVSRALSGHPNVKEEIREQVLRCAEELNFIPDLTAKIMRGESTRILGFVSTGFKNPYYLEMVKYVEKEARKNNYSLIVMNSEKDEKIERNHFRELLTRKIDGIISAPVNFKNLKLIKDAEIPVVVINEKIRWIDSFYTSLFNAGVEVAKYFKKKQFKKVCYIGEKKSEKLEGFLSEINTQGKINFSKDNILFSVNKDFEKKISELIKEIDLKCEGIFFSSDEIALLFLKECRRKHIDLYSKTLVGFDNTIISQTLGISSIEQPMERMVELAMQVLITKIENKNKIEKIFSTELEPQLIIRS